MHFLALIALINLIGLAFGRPLVNRQTDTLPAAFFNSAPGNVTAADSTSYGLYGCTNPQWSGACAL